MVAGCGMKCIKYIVFAINFLFFVMGVVAVALGIYALVDKNDMNALTKIDSDGKLEDFNAVGMLQSGAIVLIVAGAFLLITGFMGCCGAVKEIKCLLAAYAAVVILILILQITAAALGFAFKDRLDEAFEEGLVKGVEENYDGYLKSDNSFSRAFDFAQIYFECCGVNSTDNFMNSPWYKKRGNDQIPPTCCEQKDKDKFFDDNELDPVMANCSITAPSEANPYSKQPCYDSIKDWVEDKAVIIIAIAITIVLIEIVAVVFACCLYRAIES